MEQNEFEEYLKKLKEIEKTLNDDDDDEFDLDFINEVNDILLKLNQEIKIPSSEKDDFSLKVKIKKLHENAVIPSYAKDGDAGMDLVATSIISETTEQITYGLGIALEIPKGFVGLVFPRSSIRKYELQLTNSIGVIDSGYRGEIQATFNKVHNKLNSYKVGDRIAQIIILPYPQIKFIETDNLSDSDRGSGGFGSTGS